MKLRLDVKSIILSKCRFFIDSKLNDTLNGAKLNPSRLLSTMLELHSTCRFFFIIVPFLAIKKSKLLS